ncbi:MAG: 4-alpha-glucanotransferase [Gammaproteobacteria bacterium]|nr:4-alpha-glucanotransferase [Gammaproteobacteria bacterium]
MTDAHILNKRRAGLLLHPTSLPGPYANGDIGSSAYRFVDFLVSSGCTVWQMLPLGSTHSDASPYQCLSVHAGNPKLISLDWLVEQGWLDFAKVHEPQDFSSYRIKSLHIAYQTFVEKNDAHWHKKLHEFITEHKHWLNDYALFVAIKEAHHGASWNDWPDALANRETKALNKVGKQYADQIAQIQFEQFVFFTQWHELKNYAHEQGVYLFGDIPMFVAYDSADVWACRENFLLDENGEANYVAGVPPDAFSDEGQRWGNPLYDWQYMQSKKFNWWIQRFVTQLELFDLMRIDHFRGFEAFWQIAADEETAINGKWVKSPGRQLLKALYRKFKSLPLVAEDLGLITEEVINLRQEFDLPGMKILQFAFDGDNNNIYLPHNHEQLSVVYTGTHDNDTSLGWYLNIEPHVKRYLHEYLGVQESKKLDMPWILNRMALASVANLAILPMQDILSLGSDSRMNIPGTTENNWQWRFNWEQIWAGLPADLRKLNEIYGRI